MYINSISVWYHNGYRVQQAMLYPMGWFNDSDAIVAWALKAKPKASRIMAYNSRAELMLDWSADA